MACPETAFSHGIDSPLPEFDPLACASLHNQIITILQPYAEQHNNHVVHDFFIAYGDEAQAVRDQLTQPMITFLENIDIVVSDDDAAPAVNFSPHVGMPHPGEFKLPIGGLGAFGNEDLWVDEEQENWIALYPGNEPEYAIYFNMDLELCTWQQELMPWRHDWYPLERALRLWLSLYQCGKFQPSMGQEAIYSTHDHRRHLPADSERDLQAYDDLLMAIQARCPDSTLGEPGLVDSKVLDEFHVSGFLRDFLLRARRPSFQFIAPGLHIPTSEWIQEMLCQARVQGRLLTPPDPASNYESEPLPLFPGPKVTTCSKYFELYDKEQLIDNISGLYSWPDYFSGDAVNLVLPVPIGKNGWLRPGTEYPGNDPDPQNNLLYQYGPCPFLPWHSPSLSVILRNWKRLIETGEWQVGSDGVEGGIEMWEQADTEEHYRSYSIGICIDDDA